MATLPTVQNARRAREPSAGGAPTAGGRRGFEFLSTLIEDRVRQDGPPWLASAPVLERIENYLRSGIEFVYLQAVLS